VILRWLLGQWLTWIILLERGVDERRWGVVGLLWWWLLLLQLLMLMLMLENVLRWRGPLWSHVGRWLVSKLRLRLVYGLNGERHLLLRCRVGSLSLMW
jgi:hypothetical protein